MDGLINGIYEICDTAQPLVLALVVLALLVLGIGTIVSGAEGHMKFKESMKWIIIGSAIAFGAVSIGKMIAGWFM